MRWKVERVVAGRQTKNW